MSEESREERTRKRLEDAGTFVEPESFEQGQEWLVKVKNEISDINVQLVERLDGEILTEDDVVWKKRALRARWYLKNREQYLRAWLKERRQEWERENSVAKNERRRIAADQHAKYESGTALPVGLGGPTIMLRSLAKRVGKIEAVYHAAAAYIDDASDDAWTDLVSKVDNVRYAEMGDDSPEPAGIED